MQTLQSISHSYSTWKYSAILMVLLFNNWILSPVLNPTLLKSHAEISELSIVGQPYAAVFRTFDIFSGLLFIACGTALLFYIGKRSQLLKLAALSMGVFGASNIFDAIFPLPCSETINRNCELGINTSLSNFHIPAHGISSVIIGSYYLIFPLLGAIYCWQKNLTKSTLFKISLAAIVVAVYAAIKVFYSALSSNSVPTAGGGLSQALQMTLFSIWFLVGFATICKQR